MQVSDQTGQGRAENASEIITVREADENGEEQERCHCGKEQVVETTAWQVCTETRMDYWSR